jgi:hypothetical protein
VRREHRSGDSRAGAERRCQNEEQDRFAREADGYRMPRSGRRNQSGSAVEK